MSKQQDSIIEQQQRGSLEVVRFLEENGYRHVFGLPGSSMVSVLYDLQDSPVEYVSTIHESVAVAAADGYARVAGAGLAFVYMLPGTANGLGNLHNAWRDESPVIVIASQNCSRWRTKEGTVGENDLVALTRPFTRLSQELSLGMPVRSWLEAARRVGKGTPAGPAFLSIPTDVFEEEAPGQELRTSIQAKGGAPEDIHSVVEALCTAERPVIMAGGQLRRYGGSRFIESLAERFEIPVILEGGFNDRLPISPGHSHYFGNVLTEGAKLEQEADVAIAIGCRLMLEGHPREQPWFPNASMLVHVNADQAKLEETRTADWVAACDPGSFASKLLTEMSAVTMNSELHLRRKARLAEQRNLMRSSLDGGDPVGRAMKPYINALACLHDAMDRGWVVDESVLASQVLASSLKSGDGEKFIGISGGSLGWAAGASVGVALASGEPVTAVMGDGALRFNAQGLWTINAYNLPITLIILDNGGYGSTRHFERQYIAKLGAKAKNKPSYLNSDLRELGPGVDRIMDGFGIPSYRVAPGQDPRDAILHAWEKSTQGPNAVIIPVEFEG